VADGADVIADDVGYYDQPFFQDGPIAQAVDDARSHGTLYVAAAGNGAAASWQGTFHAGAGGCGAVSGSDTTQTVATVPNNGTLPIVLQWDEPWGARSTDLDAFLVNAATGGELPVIPDVDWTSSAPYAGGFPVTYVTWTNRTGRAV